MNILYKLSKMLRNFPVKSILIAVVVIALLAVGVRNIKMATGNDTLVKSETDVFQDNLNLEEEFGGESIIVLYEADELLTPNHLEHMKGIENELRTSNSIYTMISPVTLVEEIAQKQSEQFQDGIMEIIDGLSDMGNQLLKIGADLNSPIDKESDLTGPPDFNLNGINKQLDGIADNLLLISLKMESSPMKSQIEEAGNELSTLSQKQSPEQATKQSTENKGLSVMGEKLLAISENLKVIDNYSDIMTPGLPVKKSTLDNMIFEDGELRTMFNEVVVDETHMIMLIKFKGNTSDSEKSDVVDTIKSYIKTNSPESLNIIVSGKPVLDIGIRSSMQDSLKQMMGTALLIMIVILSFVFKSRWRLLPLLTVLIAVVGTIGLMGWLNIPITMVSMAVFPILIGLGIDYAIQFQTRYTEELTKENSNE